jgi:hypothetical protein
MTARFLLCIPCIIACASCSIRYDAAGVTRVGVGLWGFGDPPGVQWNLDAPRREIPELPAAPRPELPPRTMPSSSNDDRLPATRARAFDRNAVSIKDNDQRASRRLTDNACPVARGTFARDPDSARG